MNTKNIISNISDIDTTDIIMPQKHISHSVDTLRLVVQKQLNTIILQRIIQNNIDDNSEKFLRPNVYKQPNNVNSEMELKLKSLLNNKENFERFKDIISVTDKQNLVDVIYIGRDLLGDNGNFNWIDVSAITDFSLLFYHSSFNGDISLWNVSNGINFAGMFSNASKFNKPIGKWNVSNAKFMNAMFSNASKFNQPIGKWDVSNVTNFDFMFWKASKFNQDISNWNISDVSKKYNVFCYSDYSIENKNKPLPLQDKEEYIIENVKLISDIDIDSIDDDIMMTNKSLNNQINAQNIARRNIMKKQLMDLFKVCDEYFDNTSADFDSLQELQQKAFQIFTLIDKDLNNPANFELYKAIITPKNKYELKQYIKYYLKYTQTGNLNWLDISKITNLEGLFEYRTEFQGDVSLWDVSNVTMMGCLFKDCTKFNGDISKWDVSSVFNMSAMFAHAKEFNQPIGHWDVSNVFDMSSMFDGAEAFNQPIGGWDVRNVEDMNRMFADATAFNQPLNSWKLADNLHRFVAMFANAVSFNQPLTNWTIPAFTLHYDKMFFNCPIAEENKPKKENLDSLNDLDR